MFHMGEAVVDRDGTEVLCEVCEDIIVRVEWVVLELFGDDERRMVGESCLCGDRITGMVVPV